MALGRSRYSLKRSAPSTARNRAFAITSEISKMATLSTASTVSLWVQLVKELGAEKPEVNVTQQAREKDRAYKRSFSEYGSGLAN